MHTVEIVHRVLVFTPAQVFPTPPFSLCCLLLPAVSFVGFHGLHPDSWLLLFSGRLSYFYGSAQGADRSWKVHPMRQCLVVGEELDGSCGTREVVNTVEVSRFCCVALVWAYLLIGSCCVLFCFWPIFCCLYVYFGLPLVSL